MGTNEYRLEPAYDFITNKSSVLLRQDQVEICIDGNNYTGEGDIRLDLLPRANIRIYGTFHDVSAQDPIKVDLNKEVVPTFTLNGRQIEGFMVNSTLCVSNDPQTWSIIWSPNSEPINGLGDESTQISRVVFHLFNFVDLFGTNRSSEQNGTSSHAIEHVDLDCDKWKVELKSLISTRENFKLLKAEGGYHLTHIGCIEKEDGTSFSGNDANEYLGAIRFFLSFAKGSWCDPVCAVGFDASGNRVWESWSSPRDPWFKPLSWFDPHNASQLVTLFPGFMKKWANEDWREALCEIIYWYMNANYSRGITYADTGIILTQAAIERLSYEFSVKDKQLISMDGFKNKNLWASDKFRLLFSSLNIPLDIPSETPELLACKSKMNWLDAPHALTEIRNSLIHPEHKKRDQFSTAYYEAWNLGLWFLEMGILAICGYSGTYGNRLKRRHIGQIENVPWA